MFSRLHRCQLCRDRVIPLPPQTLLQHTSDTACSNRCIEQVTRRPFKTVDEHSRRVSAIVADPTLACSPKMVMAQRKTNWLCLDVELSPILPETSFQLKLYKEGEGHRLKTICSRSSCYCFCGEQAKAGRKHVCQKEREKHHHSVIQCRDGA
jgi:hypothetical protein